MTDANGPRIWLGTMGFSYSDWAGVFYPPGTKPGDYLAWYARQFDTVELDTTFHATPPVERVKRWAEVTPDDFKFCVKTPKDVTHEGALGRRLGPMLGFLDVMRAFGPKLAVVLIQLPPSCGVDQFEELERLLKGLPRDLRFAVEFRNSSWGQQRTLDLLRERGAALVVAEYTTRPSRILVTGDFLYVRWIGEHERFEELNREQVDMTPSLEWWKGEIERVAPGANRSRSSNDETPSPQPSPGVPGEGVGRVKDVYGFFNNDYSGYSVATSRRFMAMMGLPVKESPDQDLAGQGMLFG